MIYNRNLKTITTLFFVIMALLVSKSHSSIQKDKQTLKNMSKELKSLSPSKSDKVMTSKDNIAESSKAVLNQIEKTDRQLKQVKSPPRNLKSKSKKNLKSHKKNTSKITSKNTKNKRKLWRRRRHHHHHRRRRRKRRKRRIRNPALLRRNAIKNERMNGCFLTAEFRHFFYNLLTRSSEFTIQFFSNCGNLPEMTFRVFYQNNMFINWYNHPTEVYLNLFNNVFRLQFRKPKHINEYDITKAMMYQEMSLWGLKKNPKPINLNFDNQVLLTKQHLYGFEPNNIARLINRKEPIPCFVRREMVKGWKKIIKKRVLMKRQKIKMMKMMAKMMAKRGSQRRLSLVDDVPALRTVLNRKLFMSSDSIHERTKTIQNVKRNLRLVKAKKGASVGRSLKLINGGKVLTRNLAVKKKKKRGRKEKKERRERKGRKERKEKRERKNQKRKKLIKMKSSEKWSKRFQK